MECSYYDAGRCRSCTLMGTPYPAQLGGKQAHCTKLLADYPDLEWLPPLPSPESGFRNKAKMVVSGTLRRPNIGILDADGHGIDLRRCGICSPGLTAAFPVLSHFIRIAGLVPYDVAARTGELKYLLLTESPDGELMVRFVLRSERLLPNVREHLPGLRKRLPQLAVASVNLHPEHKAVTEGETEILLSEQATLRMGINGLDLFLRPQGFFQTNTEVAAALYRQGREWVEQVAPASVWDLYCGVGGFALSVADGIRDVTGIEISAEAITAAETSRDRAGLSRVRFAAGDATAFALDSGQAPELVIVNPPRRGIGAQLAGWLEGSDVKHVVYSSCNAVSLAKDLARMPSLAPVRARVMDMFPQSTHYEAMVLLERR